VAVLIDVKTDLAESWQTICAAAAKMPYLICSACELMLEAVIHTVYAIFRPEWEKRRS
jgi:hypothetical protein